ncbi:ABC transporter ATP-binding protein [Nisaea acidiphila]|uniref:ABC transporter ATP-binding protein n=1 Tax=Nisaea acidiphila TaxID=1862145 RepID=A0A9J7AXM3_9PROT|nr:ABC transporter ATP-binding protein [Nisaea acidiphila]UUX51185.1 ABC transporter ATP-binding protein [Nisaea acidiphila]
MARITLSGIEKNFGTTRVLNGLDIDIADGEFLTLVGPSGCGKSTLLRIIAGLESQSGGDVTIDGRLVNHVRPSRRDLAMVFQSYALYPHLTVQQNMETPLRLRDMTPWERMPLVGATLPGRGGKLEKLRGLVRETAETLKIEHLLQRKPGQLSGGQRQRVALGRAMVRKPVAFLMDEPLSNLDAALRVHMRSELAELHHSLKTTFIYVTHDQAEALTMSDRMAVMMEGDILQLGAPDEIYRDPADRRVAEFIGSPRINMLDGEADADGRVVAHGIHLKRELPGGRQNLSVGVRPEHLDVLTEGGDAESWPFRVSHKENLGSDYFLHGHVNGGGQRVIARAAPELAASLSIGADIHVRPKPGTAMAFAADHRRLRFREA